MTIADRLSADELETRVQELIAEMEKSNRAQEEHWILRYNQILEGINQILNNSMQAKTEEELGQTCLSVALKVTGSQIGFINLVDVDGLLHEIAINDMGWEQCQMYDKIGHRRPMGNFVVRSLYGHVIDSGKSFFTNKPLSHPDSIGLPYGHPPVTSFLGVPLVSDGKTIGVIVVADREGGYSYEQQKDLEAIAPSVVQALQRRRSEEALCDSSENLRVHSEELNTSNEELRVQSDELHESEAKLKETLDNLEEKVKERTAELEEAYESLLENEIRLNEAQRIAHIGSWGRNLVTDELYWSDEMYRIFRVDPLRFGATFDAFLSYVHPDDRDDVVNAVKETTYGKPFDIEYRIIPGDGEERIVYMQGEAIFDEKNTPIRLRGAVQDITEHKKSEENIKILANIVESSNDAIGTISLDGIITSWNKGAELGYGYSTEEILGKPISILAQSHLMDETKRLSELVKQGQKIRNYETIRLRKDGKIIYISYSLSPVFDVHGKLTATSFISRDITKRKEAEEALAKIESARKKEIHHRIKNNLQVISSLLDLQAEKFKNRECIKDLEVLEAFRESQDRVISMAFIHEELYKGGGFDTLNFSSYIEELVENLFMTYRLGNVDISLDLNLGKNIFFDMDTAVPLGMIVNELVSNSFKHAFISRDKGEIQIILHREEGSDTFILIVADNGVGIPKDLNIEEVDSLGLHLVTTLVDQLDGELELNRNKGTEFTIRFTITEKNNPASAP
jgi:PAS domain S-box-containing protein